MSDLALTAAGFAAAYSTRSWLHLFHLFYLETPTKALLMGFSMLAWLLIGLWLRIYDRLDSGTPRVILRDTFYQCLYGAICLVLFEFSIRLSNCFGPFLS